MSGTYVGLPVRERGRLLPQSMTGTPFYAIAFCSACGARVQVQLANVEGRTIVCWPCRLAQEQEPGA